MVAEALSRDMLSQNTDEEDKPLDKEMTVNTDPEENQEHAEETILEPEVEPTVDGVPENETEPSDNHADKANAEAPVVDEQPEVTEPAGGVVEDNSEPPVAPETSALTVNDIYHRVTQAARDLLGEWCYVTYLFPEEHKALLVTENRADELSFVQVDYSVGTDDVVTVSNQTNVKLTVSVADINSKVAELNETIVDLNQQLSDAKNEISALTPYREAHEKAMHDQKAAELRDYIKRSGQFTAKEIEGEEISALIDALDEDKIKMMISDRVVSSNKKQTLKASVPRANISADDASDTEVSEVLSTFFRRNK